MGKKIIFIIVLSISFLSVKSQSNKQINNREILEGHLNGVEFVAGEEIWFKLYCLNIQQDTLSSLSSLAYVELINPRGYSIVHKKVLLNEGAGSNFINIPDTISGGVYRMIAYTNWMRNFNYNDFFSKDILIHNPEKRKTFNDKERKTHISQKDYQISLENNELVDGLTSIVHLKARSFNDIDSSVCTLIDKNNDVMDSIRIQEKFNRLSFTPEFKNEYSIKIRSRDTMIKKKLPEVKKEGINFHVRKINKDSVCYLFQGNQSRKNNTSYYRLRKGGDEVIIGKFPPNGNEKICFPTAFLNKNYTKLILENDRENVVWSRKFFKPYSDELVNIKGLENKYETKSNLEFEIEAPLSSNSSPSFLSLSIRKIANPSRGFKSKQEKSKSLKKTQTFQYVNNELLFKQDGFYNPHPEEKFQAETSRIVLPGKLYPSDESSVKDKSVTLSFVDSVTRIKRVKTNESGDFMFQVYPYKPKVEMVFKAPENQVNKLEIKNKFLEKFKSFIPDQSAYHNRRVRNEEYIKKLYLSQRIRETYEINNINLKSGEENRCSNTWTSYSFYGPPDESINFDEYVMLDSLREYFRELITWTRLSKNNGKLALKIINKEDDKPFQGKPAVFIDGVLYDNIESLMSIEPNLCEKIEIVRSPLLLRDRLYYGAFALYTKNTNMGNISLSKNTVRVNLPLYHPNASFKIEGENRSYPDFRNTMYWNSDIVIKDSNTVKMQVKTPLNESWYQLKVFGISGKGKLIQKEKQFKVAP